MDKGILNRNIEENERTANSQSVDRKRKQTGRKLSAKNGGFGAVCEKNKLVTERV